MATIIILDDVSISNYPEHALHTILKGMGIEPIVLEMSDEDVQMMKPPKTVELVPDNSHRIANVIQSPIESLEQRHRRYKKSK